MGDGTSHSSVWDWAFRQVWVGKGGESDCYRAEVRVVDGQGEVGAAYELLEGGFGELFLPSFRSFLFRRRDEITFVCSL